MRLLSKHTSHTWPSAGCVVGNLPLSHYGRVACLRDLTSKMRETEDVRVSRFGRLGLLWALPTSRWSLTFQFLRSRIRRGLYLQSGTSAKISNPAEILSGIPSAAYRGALSSCRRRTFHCLSSGVALENPRIYRVSRVGPRGSSGGNMLPGQNVGVTTTSHSTRHHCGKGSSWSSRDRDSAHSFSYHTLTVE